MAFHSLFGIAGTRRVELAAGGQERRKDAFVDQQSEDRRTLGKALQSDRLSHHGVVRPSRGLAGRLRGKHVGFPSQDLSRAHQSLFGRHGRRLHNRRGSQPSCAAELLGAAFSLDSGRRRSLPSGVWKGRPAWDADLRSVGRKPGSRRSSASVLPRKRGGIRPSSEAAWTAGSLQPLPGQPWIDYFSELTVRTCRPFARRLASTLLPPGDFILARKPCVLARRRRLG